MCKHRRVVAHTVHTTWLYKKKKKKREKYLQANMGRSVGHIKLRKTAEYKTYTTSLCKKKRNKKAYTSLFIWGKRNRRNKQENKKLVINKMSKGGRVKQK